MRIETIQIAFLRLALTKTVGGTDLSICQATGR